MIKRLFLLFFCSMFVLLLGPLAVWMFGDLDKRGPWWSASRASSGKAPDPASEPGAVVQVYGARTLGWRGAFAVHTWIATKRAGESTYRIHHVVGWHYYRGGRAVVSRTGTPDFKWFGAVPDVLADHRGPPAEAMIDQIEQAVDDYPYDNWYRVWPGPNSNTFTAFVARQVPDLAVDLPPTAIGKDFLGGMTLLAPAPSGTGWQLSLYGLASLTIAWREGLEIGLMGLSAGLDLDDWQLRLPGIGRLGG